MLFLPGHIQDHPWYKALSRNSSTAERHQSTFNTHLITGWFSHSYLIVGARSDVGHVSTLRGGVVTTSDRLVVSVIVERTVSGSAVRRSDGRAGHVGVVAGTVIAGTGSESRVAGGGGGRDGGDFRVVELIVALLALPELVAGALGVAVIGARAEALLLLVMAAKEDLDRDGDEEEEAGWS